MKPIRHFLKKAPSGPETWERETLCSIKFRIEQSLQTGLERVKTPNIRYGWTLNRVTCKRCQATTRYKQLWAKYTARRLKGHT